MKPYALGAMLTMGLILLCPVAKAAETSTEQVKEASVRLETLAEVHPRILLNEEGFGKARSMAQGGLAEEWAGVKKKADIAAAQPPPDYYEDSNPENLWIRTVGENLKLFCMVYRISEDAKYKDAADRWADALMAYPSWGYGSYTNNDLACASGLLGLSCYYDWLYEELTPQQRQAALDVLIQRGGDMAKISVWWRVAYLQNHMWVSLGGLMSAAAAIYDQYPPALDWMDIVKQKYTEVFHFLGQDNDGSSHEGFQYWTYGMQYMGYYLTLERDFLGLDHAQEGYIRNGGRYAGALVMPDSYSRGYFTIYNYGDANHTARYTTDFIPCVAFLAGYTRDPETQGFLRQYLDAVNDDSGNGPLGDLFLWYDPNLPASAPDWTDSVFPNLGFWISRSSWKPGASVVAFRCGPVLGKEIAEHPYMYDLGLGHNHGDINAPWVYGYGDVQLAESGYAIRDTASHSTLLVNGMGQEKDKVTAIPSLLTTQTGEGYTYAAADGTAIYPAESGLVRFRRHFIHLKPDILLLVDEVETRQQGIPLELRFFPEGQSYVTDLDGSFLLENSNSRLRICAMPQAAGITVVCKDMHKEIMTVKGVQINTENQTLLLPTALSWAPKGETPARITVEKQEDGVLVFDTGSQRVALNPQAQTVEVENIDLDVTEAVICQGDKPFTGGVPEEGMPLTVKLSAPSSLSDRRKVEVFLALYHVENGMEILIALDAAQVKIPSEGGNGLETEIRLSIPGDSQGQLRVKAFVWSDMQTMKPLYTTAAEINQ